MTKAKALLAPKGIATGLNKGHLVVKRAVKLNKKTGKPAALSRGIRSKGKLSKKVAAIRAVIRDTVGFAPYERRIVEVLKGGVSNPQKRAYKYAKARLGTHLRAKRKVREMEDVVARATIKRK